MSNRIMWVAIVRALYLQALHPRVIRGTLQNAATITQPVDAWARLRRTLTFIEARTFGTTAEAERAGLRVRKIHQVLTGTDPDLAVARGAATYGLARRGRGVRIRIALCRTT